jgi:CHASE3 domain sensor protein
MGRVSRKVKRLANDPSAGSRPFLNLRLTSIRTWIIGSILVILILLLGAAIFTSMTFSRIDRAIATAEEAQERANAALEVGKAAADLHAALAQGTLKQDPDEFTQTVSDAEQALLGAEERLTEEIGPLPQDDPMQISLDRLETSTTRILILAESSREEAEAGRWWLDRGGGTGASVDGGAPDGGGRRG